MRRAIGLDRPVQRVAVAAAVVGDDRRAHRCGLAHRAAGPAEAVDRRRGDAGGRADVPLERERPLRRRARASSWSQPRLPGHRSRARDRRAPPGSGGATRRTGRPSTPSRWPARLSAYATILASSGAASRRRVVLVVREPRHGVVADERGQLSEPVRVEPRGGPVAMADAGLPPARDLVRVVEQRRRLDRGRRPRRARSGSPRARATPRRPRPRTRGGRTTAAGSSERNSRAASRRVGTGMGRIVARAEGRGPGTLGPDADALGPEVHLDGPVAIRPVDAAADVRAAGRASPARGARSRCPRRPRSGRRPAGSRRGTPPSSPSRCRGGRP